MTRIFAFALLLAASAVAQADVTQPVCTQTGPRTYKISFTLTGDSHSVAISASSDPRGKSGRISILETIQTEVTVDAGGPGQRMFFFLKPDHGHEREVSIRHIALEGTPNFRDVGGYETTDGRFVKWGLVYRTGVLSYLTASDFSYLSQLGVRVVCDFRTKQENDQAPEVWVPNSGATMISLPIGDSGGKDVSASLQKFTEGNPTVEEFKQRMERTYSTFAFEYAPAYSHVFDELKKDDLPLVYHCTAGKDRTGVFTALLLRVLGVPQETVLEDYALTDKYFMSTADHTQSSDKARAQAKAMMQNFTREQQQVLMAADPNYLKATFRAIDEKYSNFDNYRRQALGVSDSDAETLRARLLSDE